MFMSHLLFISLLSVSTVSASRFLVVSADERIDGLSFLVADTEDLIARWEAVGHLA